MFFTSMKTSLLTYSWLASFLLCGNAVELDEKSARYHEMLRKKPENTAVLSRFVDSWLENADQNSLITILEKKATEGNAADWRVLAAYHEFSGNDEKALTALDKAINADPNEPASRLARAKLLGKLLSFEKAISDLTEATKVPALQLEATTLLGRFLARAGKPDQAVEAWSKLIAEHPEDIGLQEDLLDLLIEENLMEQAVITSKKLTDATKDPYQKAIRRLRTAEIFSLSQKKQEASEEYQAILALSAQDSWLERETLALAQKLFSTQEDSSGWKKFLDAALVAAPKRGALLQSMAQHLLATGDIDGAVAIHRDLIKSNPGVRAFRESLITLLEQSGRTKEAAEELNSLLAQEDKDPILWEKLAGFYRLLNDPKNLAAAINRAAALIANDEAGLIQKAQLYLRFEFFPSAEIILRNAAATYGPLSEAADNLAVYLASHNKADEAVKLWTEAAKNADREGILRISRSLTAHGKINEAYQIIEDRVKEFSDDTMILTALCQAASLTDQADLAIPHALQLIKRSESNTDIENSIKTAVTLIQRAEKNDEIANQLAASDSATIGELCLLAQLQELSGDSIAAEKTLERATKKDDALSASMMRVNLHESRGDLAAATTAMRDLIARPGGTKPHFLKRLVELLQQSGDTEAAITEVMRWKTIAPGDKAAWLKHAELFADQGEPEKAAAELRRACAKFGNDAEMRLKLATTQIEAGADHEAMRILMQLHDEAESSAEKIKYATQIATVSMTDGRNEELEQIFRKRCRDNATAVAPLLSLRSMLEVWNRQDEANELLMEAARRKPDDLELQSQISDHWESMGEIQKAEAIFLGLLTKQSTPDLKRRLAAFYLRNDQSAKAQAIILDLALSSNDARQIETIAVNMITAKQHAEAETMLRTSAAKFPQDWRIRYLLAYSLELQKKDDEAFPLFVELSQVRSEIPGFTAPVATTQQTNHFYGNPYGRYNPMRLNSIQPISQKKIPKGSINEQIQNFIQFARLAFLSPNYNHNAYISGYGMPSNALQLHLPHDSERLRLFALLHGFSIAQNGDQKLLDQRLGKITSDEYPFWEALKKVALVKNREDYPKLLESKPLDPHLVRVLIPFIRSYDENAKPPVPSETWLRISNEFSKADPALAYDALIASYDGIANEDHTSEEWQKLLDLLERIPPKDRQPRLYLYTGIKSKKEKIQVTEAQQQLIDRLVKESTDLEKKNDSQKLSDLGEKIHKTASSGDFVAAADLSNQFIKLADKVQQNSPSYYYQTQQYLYGNGHHQRLMQEHPQPFSPDELLPHLGYQNLMETAVQYGVEFIRAYLPRQNPQSAKLSENRIALMKALNISEKNQEDQSTSAKLNISDPAKFLEALQKLERPLDRVLALYACQVTTALDSILPTLTAEAANPDAKLLLWTSAYYSSTKQNTQLAYELAVRARKVAKRELQGVADAHIAALGLKIAATPDHKINLDETGSAILRLSKLITEEHEKTQIAKKLKSLGLEQAALRLTRPVVARKTSTSRSFQHPSMTSRQFSQDAAALVRKGNRAAAAKKAYQQIKTLLKPSQGQNNQYYLREFITSIAPLKLQNELKAMEPPAASASFEEKLLHLQILCLLSPPSTYLKELDQLYAINPQDPTLISLLSQAAGQERHQELAQKFAQLSASQVQQISQAMTYEMQNFSNNLTKDGFEKLLMRYHFLALVLEATDPKMSRDHRFSMIGSVAQNLTQGFYVDQKSIRALTTPPPAVPAKDDPIETKRDQTMQKLAMAMLRHQDTAEVGFQILLSAKKTFALEDKQLAEIAQKTYLDYLSHLTPQDAPAESTKTPLQLGAPQLTQNVHNASSNQQQLHSLTQFLMNSKHDISFERDTLTAPIKEPALVIVNQWLDFFVKPEKSTAITLSAEINKNRRLLVSSLEIAQLSGINYIEAIDMLLDQLASSSKIKTSGNFVTPDRNLISMLLSQALQNAEPEAALERIIARYLGPKELWPLYEVSPAMRQGNYDSSEIGNRINHFQSLVQQHFQETRSIALTRYLLANDLGAILNLNSSSQRLTLGNEAASNLSVLQESRIMHAGSGMFLADGSFLLEKEIYYSHSSGDNKEQKELGTLLMKVEGNQRFWSRIYGAFLLKENASVVATEITREKKNISSWSKMQQQYFAKWAYSTWPDLSKSSLREWLKFDTKSDYAEAEKFLRELPTVIADGNFDDEYISSQLIRIINHDPKKAASIWSTIMSECATQNLPVRANYNGVSLRTHEYMHVEMLQNFEYSNQVNQVNPLHAIHFLVALEKAKIASPMRHDYAELIVEFVDRIGSGNAPIKLDPTLAKLRDKRLANQVQLIASFTASKEISSDMLIKLMPASTSYSINDEATYSFLTDWIKKNITSKNSTIGLYANFHFLSNYSSMRDKKRQTSLIAVYDTLMNDAKLSDEAKISLALKRMEYEGSDTSSEKFDERIIDLLAKNSYTDEKNLYTAYQMLYNLRDKIGVSPKIAARFCREVYPKYSAAYLSSPNFQRNYQEQNIAPLWLNAAVKSQEPELFEEFLRIHPEAGKGNLECLVDLIINHWDDKALALLPKAGMLYQMPAGLLVGNESGSRHKFTADLESRLAEFLPKIEDPQVRYRFECVVSNLRDATEKAKPSKSRIKRLIALADRFAAEAPSQNLIRMELLAMIDSGTDYVNLPEMLKIAAPLDFADVVEARHPNNSAPSAEQQQLAFVQQAMIERTMSATLRAGQHEFYLKQMKSLTLPFSNNGNSSYYASQYFASNLMFHAPTLLNTFMIDGEKKKKLAMELIDLYTQASTQRNTSSYTFYAYYFSLITHTLSGQSDKFNAWTETLPPDFHRSVAEIHANPSYMAHYLRQINWKQFVDAKGKSNVPLLMTRMLSDPHTNKFFLSHQTIISSLMDNKIFTYDQMREIIENVPDTCERKPLYLTERAGIIGWRKKDFAAAEKDYDRARELAGELKQEASIHIANAYQARMYADNGKRAEGEKLAALVDISLLPEKDKQFFAPLSKFAKKPAEKPATTPKENP